jgi:hypothetical protein
LFALLILIVLISVMQVIGTILAAIVILAIAGMTTEFVQTRPQVTISQMLEE